MVRELHHGGSERQMTETALALDRTRFEPHVGAFIAGGSRADELRAYVEGNETLTLVLSNATNGAGVGNDSVATLTIMDDPSVPTNSQPIDDAGDFVCQHYHDFLGREADAGGATYWTSQITQCGNDPVCIRNKRVDVSDAFFFEQEFQETGAFVYRVYKAAFGQRPSYGQFMPDRSRVIGSCKSRGRAAGKRREPVLDPGCGEPGALRRLAPRSRHHPS